MRNGRGGPVLQGEMSSITEETSKDMRGWSSQERSSRVFRSFQAAEQPIVEEYDERKMQEPASPQTSFFKLLAHADGLDYVLMLVGSVGAIYKGLLLPLSFFFIGSVINQFGKHSDSDPKKLLESVSKLSEWYAVIAVGGLFATWAEVACWMYSGQRQTTRLRKLYLQAILRQEVGFFEVEMVTDILEQFTTNCHYVHEAISGQVGNYISKMATFAGGVALGFFSCWQTAALTMATMPVIAVAGFLANQSQTKFEEQKKNAYSTAGGIAEEVISQIRTVYAYVWEMIAMEAYEHGLHIAYILGHKAAMAKGMGLGIILGVVNLSWALELWFGGWFVRRGDCKGGHIIIAVFCLMSAGVSLGEAAPIQQSFNKGKVAAYKIYQVIDRKPLIRTKSKMGKILSQVEGHIKFKDVTFAYPTRPNRMVLKNFSLAIPKGKTIAIVGKSGSGKSTIISLIERFYDPISGVIKIDGHNIKHLQLRWLRQHIGLVSKEPVLFSSSIRDCVTYGKENAKENEIIEACKVANAYDLISNLSNGFETQIGECGTQLSIGQKQCIAIAQVVMKNPKILLLDEVTSALDATNEQLVQSALDNMRDGRTTIVIAHRLSSIKNADMIAVLENGTIVEQGSHAQLLTTNPDGPYACFFEEQESLQEAFTPTILPKSPQASPKQNGFDAQGHLRQKVIGNVPSASPMHMMAMMGSPISVSMQSSGVWSITTNNDQDSKQDMESDDYSLLQGIKDVEIYPKEYDSRLRQLSMKEWPSLAIGAIGASITGAINPILAFLLIRASVTFYSSDFELMKREVGKVSLILLGMGIISFISTTLQHLSFGHAGEKITKQVRSMMFQKLLCNEVGWYDREENNSAALTTRLSLDAASVKGVITGRVSLIVQDLSSVVVALIVGFVLERHVAVVILLTYPLLIFGGWAQSIQGSTGDLQEAHEKANAVVKQAVSNIRTVASFSAEEKVVKQFGAHLDDPERNSWKEGVGSGFFVGLSKLTLHGSNAFNLWWCAYLTSKHQATFMHSLQVFLVLTFTAHSLAEALRMAPNLLKEGRAVVEVFKIIDREPLIDPDSKSGKILATLKGRIDFVNVDFRYPTRSKSMALRNFSLAIPLGAKKVALVGQSGAGKSSIFPLLLRFYDIQSGYILLDGVDIKSINLQWLRGQIGLVQQEPDLFNTTIAENILFGSYDASDGEMIEAAKCANAHSFISSLPLGYETNVGERGKHLTGGQKRRIAIARAVLKNPSILLLDEATGALDTESEKVQSALDRLMRRVNLTLIVAHRLSTIQDADLIVVLGNGGAVVEKGTHSSLQRRGGAYAQLIQQQQWQ